MILSNEAYSLRPSLNNFVLLNQEEIGLPFFFLYFLIVFNFSIVLIKLYFRDNYLQIPFVLYLNLFYFMERVF